MHRNKYPFYFRESMAGIVTFVAVNGDEVVVKRGGRTMPVISAAKMKKAEQYSERPEIQDGDIIATSRRCTVTIGSNTQGTKREGTITMLRESEARLGIDNQGIKKMELIKGIFFISSTEKITSPLVDFKFPDGGGLLIVEILPNGETHAAVCGEKKIEAVPKSGEAVTMKSVLTEHVFKSSGYKKGIMGMRLGMIKNFALGLAGGQDESDELINQKIEGAKGAPKNIEEMMKNMNMLKGMDFSKVPGITLEQRKQMEEAVAKMQQEGIFEKMAEGHSQMKKAYANVNMDEMMEKQRIAINRGRVGLKESLDKIEKLPPYEKLEPEPDLSEIELQEGESEES